MKTEAIHTHITVTGPATEINDLSGRFCGEGDPVVWSNTAHPARLLSSFPVKQSADLSLAIHHLSKLIEERIFLSPTLGMLGFVQEDFGLDANTLATVHLVDDRVLRLSPIQVGDLINSYQERHKIAVSSEKNCANTISHIIPAPRKSLQLGYEPTGRSWITRIWGQSQDSDIADVVSLSSVLNEGNGRSSMRLTYKSDVNPPNMAIRMLATIYDALTFKASTVYNSGACQVLEVGPQLTPKLHYTSRESLSERQWEMPFADLAAHLPSLIERGIEKTTVVIAGQGALRSWFANNA